MGMFQPISPRRPQAPETSLLTAAWQFPPGERDFERWRSGVGARNLVCLDAASDDSVCRDTGDDRDDPAQPGLYEFKPLATYLPHGCDGFIDNPDEWKADAKAALLAKLPYQVGHELWTGTQTGNPSLQSTATTSDSTGLAPLRAVSVVVSDYEACTQGVPGFLHVPSALYPALKYAGYFRTVGGRHVTDTGHVVVFGPGYPNSDGDWGPYTDPDDPDTAQAAAEGEVWVYMSPPVEFAGPEFVNLQNGDIEFWEVRKNAFLVMPEVRSIYRFDTCCVFGALAAIPDVVT